MKKILYTLSLTIFALCIFVAGAEAQTSGWSNPTATPPNGNASAPLHVGSQEQTKAGTLGVSGTAGGFRIWDRTNATQGWQWYANNDTTSNTSWLRLWNYQGQRDQVTVDGTGMRLFGNLWAGGLITNTLQVTGGTPQTGKVLVASDDFGNAQWDNLENVATETGATILIADLVIPSLTTIGSSGTNITPYTVSVPGAKVGDLASVAYPAGYSYDQMTQVCGATTATVSATDTVKIQFWNSYGSSSCFIPNGTYKIHVIQKGGGPINVGSVGTTGTGNRSEDRVVVSGAINQFAYTGTSGNGADVAITISNNDWSKIDLIGSGSNNETPMFNGEIGKRLDGTPVLISNGRVWGDITTSSMLCVGSNYCVRRTSSGFEVDVQRSEVYMQYVVWRSVAY